MAEGFDGDWLDLREEQDAWARDPDLGAHLAEILPARPRLLDLGSGTGSLIRWLGPIIGAFVLGSLQQIATVTISSSANLLIIGGVLIFFVILAPKGILGLFQKSRKGRPA